MRDLLISSLNNDISSLSASARLGWKLWKAYSDVTINTPFEVLICPDPVGKAMSGVEERIAVLLEIRRSFKVPVGSRLLRQREAQRTSVIHGLLWSSPTVHLVHDYTFLVLSNLAFL